MRTRSPALLTTTAPDLIMLLLDRIEQEPCWRIVQWLRSTRETADIPLLLLAPGHPIPDDIADRLAGLRMAILPQPWSIARLANAIEGVLAGACA